MALLVTSLAAGTGAAAALPLVDEDSVDEIADEATDADAEIAASPDATIVTPGPAGACAVPASKLAVVNVAESILTVELDDEEAAVC